MLEEEPNLVEELHGWDDVNSIELPFGDVEAAKSEESKYMISQEIWTNVTEDECWKVTGKPPIDTRWVVTDEEFIYVGKRARRAGKNRRSGFQRR